MGMSLYYGGYGGYREFTVAESVEDAIRNIGVKINAPFLPITAEKIDNIDGYHISPALAAAEPETEQVQTEPPVEADKPVTLRHCKLCDFTCDNQGDLMRHYRDFHPKGA